MTLIKGLINVTVRLFVKKLNLESSFDHQDRDEVLLLTPSKSKLHAHWIAVNPLWKILQNDATPETGSRKEATRKTATAKNTTPGGYVLLQKNEDKPRIAVRIHKVFHYCMTLLYVPHHEKNLNSSIILTDVMHIQARNETKFRLLTSRADTAVDPLS